MRRKIIEAAVKLFAQKGFFEATVEDIAHAARIAKGTVYLYFRDKASLYIEIIEEHFNQAIDFLKAVKIETITSKEKLEKVTDDWLNYMMKFHQSFPMFSLENINLAQKIMKGLGPKIFIRIEEIISLIALIIEEGIKNHEFRKVNARIAALHFLNTIRTAMLGKFFLIKNTNMVKEVVIELFLKGLQERR